MPLSRQSTAPYRRQLGWGLRLGVVVAEMSRSMKQTPSWESTVVPCVRTDVVAAMPKEGDERWLLGVLTRLWDGACRWGILAFGLAPPV